MCQLTFSDLGELNRLYLTQQMVINALSNNHDGCGIFSNGVWKSETSAAGITNLGTILRSVIDPGFPTIAHVRYATDKKLVAKENSHPFVGNRLVLAHNGKLEPVDWNKTDKAKVDSYHFLLSFEEWWKDYNKLTLPEALSEYMKQWEGKFAFLIHDTKLNEYFVVRGESADLHYTSISGKLIVNTSKKDLITGVFLFSQIAQVLNRRKLSFGEIKELDKNSIYKFIPQSSSLEKVAEIVENKPVVVTTYSNGYYEALPTGEKIWRYYKTNKKDRTSNLKALEELDNILTKYEFSIHDLNSISFVLTGKNLVELTNNDWDNLKTLVARLEKEITNSKKKLWMVIESNGLTHRAYKNRLVEFPWMLNSEEVINSAIESMSDSINTK